MVKEERSARPAAGPGYLVASVIATGSLLPVSGLASGRAGVPA